MRTILSIIISSAHIFFATLLAQNSLQQENYGDRLKVGYVYSQPIKYNPMIAYTEYEQEINNLIFGDGLFTRAADGHIIRGLALSSEQETPRFWRVNLRSDIAFHDGTEITAEDVKFTFDLYKKFAMQSHLLFPMRIVSAVDIISNKSLRIILKESSRDFRETIGQLPILPKKYYEQWQNYNLLSNLPYIEPVGNGHFIFSRQLGSDVYMDTYLDHHRKRANLSGIDFIFFDTYEEMVDAFIDGRIDLITVQGKSALQKILRLSSEKEFVLVERDNIKLYYILLNTKRDPFNAVDIRRAFNYAINKKQLVERNLDNQGHVAVNILDEDSEYFFQSIRIYNYDPLRSLNILRSSGYRQQPNGKLFQQDRELKFEFYFQEGSGFEETITRLISINLAELGINMIPRPKKPAELEQLIREGKYQAVLRCFTYDPKAPAQALREFYLRELKSENGFRNFNDRLMNTLVSQSARSFSDEQIKRIIQQMQVQINSYSPSIFLFFEDRIYFAINNRFKNTKTTTFQRLEYVVKIYPKYEWFVPSNDQKY